MDELKPLLLKLCKQHGFLTNDELAELARLDRLRSVLVRCGNGRFTCAAQDVKHFIGMIGDSKGDYVRDVSLLANDAAFIGHYHSYTEFYHRQNTPPARCRPATDNAVMDNIRVSDIDADYGGTFDGFNVSSDADPGL